MKIVVVFILAYSEDYILKQVREADLFNKPFSNLAVLYPKPKALGKSGIMYDIIFNRIKGATTNSRYTSKKTIKLILLLDKNYQLQNLKNENPPIIKRIFILTSIKYILKLLIITRTS